MMRIRKWLNPINSHDTGWIKFTLDSSSHDVDCALTIADCQRSITIDCSSSIYSGGRTKAQAIKKLDMMIDSLAQVKEEYENAFEKHEKLHAEWEEKKKKK